jgi:protein-L-isoaspartate(D-aspartate) O-methyltransferase
MERIFLILILMILGLGCFDEAINKNEEERAKKDFNKEMEEMKYSKARKSMVDEQIRRRGVKDERVLQVMQRVPRHEFIPPEFRAEAYEDHPVPIGEGQTISQPYIVALMTECLKLNGDEKVLEVGTVLGIKLLS